MKALKIIKRVSALFFVFVSFIAFAPKVSAEQASSLYDDTTKELVSELEKGIDEKTADELDGIGIDTKNPDTVKEFSVEDVFDRIIELLSFNVGYAIKIVVRISALIIISTMVKNFVPDSFSTSGVFSMISVVCCVAVIMGSIQECVSSVLNALDGMNTFMTCYIPVYSSVIITGGSPTSGAAYYVILFGLCEIVAFLAKSFIMPIMSVVLCFAIVGAINPDFAFFKISSGFEKIVKWVLGAVMTVVGAVLSIQSVIGVSTDTVSVKTVKYAVATFVPIVGGAVSDAYSTVKTSVGIIRSGIGGIGIIVLLFIALSPIITTAVMRLSVMTCEVIADMFGEKSISGLMSSVSSMLSICLSTIVCVSLSFIISTAVMMLVGTNIS